MPGLCMAWRSPVRHTGFLLVAALNLALGVAATMGAFALLDSLILHRPPLPAHARVVLYGENSATGPVRYASPLLYRYVGQAEAIESRGLALTPETVNAQAGRDTVLASAQRMDPGFLPTLGVRPEHGEGLSGKPGEALVSHGFWRGRLHADPRALGSTMIVNGRPTVIRGILPADYRFFSDVEVFLPLDLAEHAGDNAANMTAVARLKPGVPVAAFSRTVTEVASGHAAALRIGPERLPFQGATRLDAQITELARPTLLMFFGCSCVVLLISGLNLSNLLLVRAVARSHETAVRVALGARGWRPWVPAVTEAAWIGLLATAAGMPLGRLVAHVFASFLPDEWMISPQAIQPDWHVRLFGIGVAALSLGVALAGCSLQESSDTLFREQFSAGRNIAGGWAWRRARWVMNVLQTALAVMLLVLWMGSAMRLWTLERVPWGFAAADATVFDIKADNAQFPGVADVVALFDAIRTRLLGRHGIDAVGMSNYLPASGSFVMPFALPDGTVRYTQYGLVTPGALRAMGLRLVSGRYIDANDVASAERVAVVNEAYLRLFNAGGTGARVAPASRLAPNAPLRIVGVVADTRHAGPALAAEPTVFIPLAQAWESSFAFVRLLMPMHIVVRGAAAPTLRADEVYRDIHAIAPFLAVANGRSLRADAVAATADGRRDAAVSATFATFALLLVCIGLYSSQAVEVLSQRHDFALRGALGATPLDLAGLVISRNLTIASIGAALGLGASLVLRHGAPASVFAARTTVDATVVASACATVLFAAVLASGWPAWRAARIDPLHVIRGE